MQALKKGLCAWADIGIAAYFFVGAVLFQRRVENIIKESAMVMNRFAEAPMKGVAPALEDRLAFRLSAAE